MEQGKTISKSSFIRGIKLPYLRLSLISLSTDKLNPFDMIRTLLLSCVFLWLHLSLHAQFIDSHNSVLPLKNGSEILFGKDIIINDQPDQSQLDVEVCSAFNGWLYAAYWYQEPVKVNGKTFMKPIIAVMKSLDNGMNWTTINEVDWESGMVWVEQLSITTTGQSVSDIKLLFH